MFGIDLQFLLNARVLSSVRDTGEFFIGIAQQGKRLLQMIFEQVGHRHQFDILVACQQVEGCDACRARRNR